MENKYYTPEIEELHVGFEVEKQNQELIGIEIKKKFDLKMLKIDYEMNHNSTFKNHFINSTDISIYELNPHLLKTEIRVKHLDREDIESLGWVFSHSFNMGSVYDVYKAHGCILEFYDKSNSISIDGQGFKPSVIGLTIKNKSELKKLMQMLNINSGGN
jgi:hypothetical protein